MGDCWALRLDLPIAVSITENHSSFDLGSALDIFLGLLRLCGMLLVAWWESWDWMGDEGALLDKPSRLSLASGLRCHP